MLSAEESSPSPLPVRLASCEDILRFLKSRRDDILSKITPVRWKVAVSQQSHPKVGYANKQVSLEGDANAARLAHHSSFPTGQITVLSCASFQVTR